MMMFIDLINSYKFGETCTIYITFVAKDFEPEYHTLYGIHEEDVDNIITLENLLKTRQRFIVKYAHKYVTEFYVGDRGELTVTLEEYPF